MSGAGGLYLTGSRSPQGRGIGPVVSLLPAVGDFRKQSVLTRMRIADLALGSEGRGTTPAEAEGGTLRRSQTVSDPGGAGPMRWGVSGAELDPNVALTGFKKLNTLKTVCFLAVWVSSKPWSL